MAVCLRRSLLSILTIVALTRPAGAQPPAPVPAAQVPADPPVVDVTPPELANRPATFIDALPPRNGSSAFLTSAEYLLMRPYRRPSDFAIVDPANDLTPQGKIESVNYDLASGVRAGIGFRPAGSAWETVFTYTYLHDGGDKLVVAPTGGVVYPTLTRPGLIDTVSQSDGTSSFNYNLFDLETARRFCIDDTFAFRLGFGVRYASIDQSLNAFYQGGDANSGLTQTRMNFDGAGPMVSGEGIWMLPRGFQMFGRVRGSLVVGNLSSQLRETDNNGTTLNADVSERNVQLIPVLEMATGVAWEYRSLRISAGYEVANWFGLIDGPQFVDDFAEGKIGRRHGDLSLEGLFVQLGLTY